MIQTDILELVMSMSKSERRLFKIATKTYSHKEINLIESLFDIYCKNDDVKKINQKARSKISSSRLNRMHSELYKKLQSFIGDEEIKNEQKYRLYKNIFIARALLKRKLYKQANNIIEKTITEALEFEIYPVLVEAFSIKQFLQKYIGSLKDGLSIEKSFLLDFSEVIQKNYTYYKNFNIYTQLQSEFAKNGPIRNEDKISEFNKLTENIKIDIQQGFNINKVNLLCLSMLGKLKQDSEIVLETKQNLYQNYLDHPKFIEYNPSEFFLTCYNYAGNLIAANQLENVGEMLEKLEKLAKNKDSLRNKEFFIKGLQLSYYLKNTNYLKSLKYAQDFQLFLQTTDDYIYLNFIAVNIVIAYLINEQYETALESINTVLNRNIKTLRKDCYSLLLTYEIIIYIKLEWLDLVDSKIKSLNRYLKLHYNKTAFEKWLLKFLNRTQKTNFNEACIDAYNSLDALNSDLLSKGILNLSEFKIWFESELKL